MDKYQSFFNNRGSRPKQILIMGLKGAGKKEILNKFQLGKVDFKEVKGFNVHNVLYNNIYVTLFDVTDKNEGRNLRKLYYRNPRGLIFVVDSTERERMQEAKEELDKILCDDDLKTAALIVFANKQDLPGAMDKFEIEYALELSEAIFGRAWPVQPTSATTEDGLYEGLKWLTEHM